MAGVLIVGASGLLGQALQRRKRAGVALDCRHHHRPIPGTRPFDLRQSFRIPPGDHDAVILTLPIARILEEAHGGFDGAAVDALVDSIGTKSVVLLSTDAVFSGRQGGYGEASPPDPASRYGRIQAALDDAFLAALPRAAIVRTSFLFGGRFPDFDKRLGPFRRGEAVVAEQRWPHNIFRSPTEADFCAEGVWRCLETDHRGVMNVCGPRLSIRRFFEAGLSHLDGLRMPPPHRETRDDIAVDTSLDTSLMASRLGLDPARMWDWYARD